MREIRWFWTIALAFGFMTLYPAYSFAAPKPRPQDQEMPGAGSPSWAQGQSDEVTKMAFLNAGTTVDVNPSTPVIIPATLAEIDEAKSVFGTNVLIGIKTITPLSDAPEIIKFYKDNAKKVYVGEKITGGYKPVDNPYIVWLDKNNRTVKDVYLNNISVTYAYGASGNMTFMAINSSPKGPRTIVTKESLGVTVLNSALLSLTELTLIDGAAQEAAKKLSHFWWSPSSITLQLANFKKPAPGASSITYDLLYAPLHLRFACKDGHVLSVSFYWK